ncbi:WD40 repeat-like protein [Microthyrium microscopicum]|uniref:WD40 repeat-like protein n=1 Tax=Microthyrium microscopicum TaxID=703497 RepID=A0A6A6UJL1_9PEZI|nr:WD40 repeat-like protein [Microthyrium microscopicum]
MMAFRLRGRPAHSPGPAYLSYTPNGDKIVTVGMNNAIRIFQTGSDEEPITLDNCSGENTAVVATDDFFLVGNDDGTVSKYDFKANSLGTPLIRLSLPVRDISLSPDGIWAAIASDEIAVKVIRINDTSKVLHLRDHMKPIKHVSFDTSGTVLAASCSDGSIYFYSLSSEQPQLVKKVDGLIKALDNEAEASSKVVWHPAGGSFGTPVAGRDFQVTARGDWSEISTFKDGHSTDISAAAWSPNGALLVTTSIDKKLILWDTKELKILKTYDPARETILAMHWHPTKNILTYTNNDGELYIHEEFVPQEFLSFLKKGTHRMVNGHAPDSPSKDSMANGMTNGARGRSASMDSLDEILGLDGNSQAGADDFIVDDDGAGYAEAEMNGNGKRTNGHLPSTVGHSKKYRSTGSFKPDTHESFQPGSTPWRGNRRYLCLNLIGFVWTVDQGDYHTVTVEFQDRGFHRDFHFTDPFLYDKACLNENGTLFACPPRADEPAQVFYRPHETWTTRTDWRTQLPKGESVTAIALSDSYVTVTTSTGYVRVYTLFGVPFRIYRQKASPAVTCAAWRDYVLTIGNGAVGADGRSQLVYTLENVKRDEIHQSSDIVALSPGATLQSVFFSDQGDPHIYDSTGTLLVLSHWRTPGQARWIPLLDTRLLDRLATGKKDESYWPVAVAQDRFHCIILKGGDKHPYFPRPLLTDFAFQVPIASTARKDPDEMETDTPAASTHEQSYLLNNILSSLLSDLIDSTHSTAAQRLQLTQLETESDKALLQLLMVECLQGEERGMKCLEIAGLLNDRSGKMLPAAQKVAQRYGREILSEKIGELAEQRLMAEREGERLPLGE